MAEELIKTSIIKIGNSQGIRIPKAILSMLGIERCVELLVRDGVIIIKPIKKCRIGWEESFREMHLHQDDENLDRCIATDWDNEEWDW